MGVLEEEFVTNSSPEDIEYPIGVKKKNHLRINAREYYHPHIESVSLETALSKLTGEETAEEHKAVLKKTEKKIVDGLYGSAKLGKRLFTFYTYVPGSFNDETSAEWGEYETDKVRGVLKSAVEGAESIMGKIPVLGSVLQSTVGDGLAYGLYKAGKALVPADTSIFKGVGKSSFNLSVKFTPRNSSEAKQMLKAIKLFRKGTRPTLSDDNIFFNYPPLYDITVCPASSIEEVKKSSYQKYPPMALTKCDITYSNATQISTFFDDGTPTDAIMNLSFEAVVVNYNGAKWELGSYYD